MMVVMSYISSRRLFLISVLMNIILLIRLINYCSTVKTAMKQQPAMLSQPLIPLFHKKDAKTSIFFLKTHKTGGSVIQNILLRKAMHYNLSVGLSSSAGDWTRFCINSVFSTDCLCNQPEVPLQVIAHHMVYNHSAVRASLHKDAKFVSIIRDPVDIITSGYTYFDWDKSYQSLQRFLDDTETSNLIGSLAIPYRNLMMYVFGLKPADFDNEKDIKSKLEEIESTFDLIMINDKVHFHQSLILLKDLMNWTTEDIAVLAVNQQMTSRPKPNVTEELRQRLVKANHADQMLYDTFLPIFEEKVKAFGAEKMRSEISILVQRTRELKQMCIAGTKPGPWNTLNYVLTPEGEINSYCRYMAATEIDLIRTLISRYNSKKTGSVCPM